jgi:hypothetical protein
MPLSKEGMRPPLSTVHAAFDLDFHLDHDHDSLSTRMKKAIFGCPSSSSRSQLLIVAGLFFNVNCSVEDVEKKVLQRLDRIVD